MEKYAQYYSVFGLEEMIDRAKTKIEQKKIEREDVGLKWTSRQIENHRHTINEEITIIEMELHQLEGALKIKIQQQMQ